MSLHSIYTPDSACQSRNTAFRASHFESRVAPLPSFFLKSSRGILAEIAARSQTFTNANRASHENRTPDCPQIRFGFRVREIETVNHRSLLPSKEIGKRQVVENFSLVVTMGIIPPLAPISDSIRFSV
jgi:hypothetical protein